MAALADAAAGCTRCGLAATRTTVVFASGDPEADLMVIGEAPGREEDERGTPFVGRSGQLLDRVLAEEAGLGRTEVYVTNLVKCRPPANRNPSPVEIGACHPYLEAQLALVRPRVVLTLGNFPTRTLLGTKAGITTLRGRPHPWEGRILVPTWHPAAALRGGATVQGQLRADVGQVAELLAGAASRPGAVG